MSAQEVIGNSSKNLVLKTFGKVYLDIGGKLHDIDFSKIIKNNNNISSGSQTITKDEMKSELANYVTNRSFEDVKIAQKQLESSIKTLGDNFSSPISPVAVNTMQLSIGANNSQFDWIGYDTNKYDYLVNSDDIITHNIIWSGNSIILDNNCWIIHYSLNGPDEVKPEYQYQEYCKWRISNYSSDENICSFVITSTKDLYLYLKVSRNVNEHKEGTGIFVLSEEARDLNYENGYYYILYAFIHPTTKKIDKWNGFTEITPGQITANKFSSTDGNQYIDFSKQTFRVGNKENYIEWNNNNSSELNIQGKINVTDGGKIGNYDISNGYLVTSTEVSNVNSVQYWPGLTNGTVLGIALYDKSKQYSETITGEEKINTWIESHKNVFPDDVGMVCMRCDFPNVNVVELYFTHNWQQYRYKTTQVYVGGSKFLTIISCEIKQNFYDKFECVSNYDYVAGKVGLYGSRIVAFESNDNSPENTTGLNVSAYGDRTYNGTVYKPLAIDCPNGQFRGFRPVIVTDLANDKYGGIVLVKTGSSYTLPKTSVEEGRYYEFWSNLIENYMIDNTKCNGFAKAIYHDDGWKIYSNVNLRQFGNQFGN